MSESEFLALAEATLTQIEAALDRLADLGLIEGRATPPAGGWSQSRRRVLRGAALLGGLAAGLAALPAAAVAALLAAEPGLRRVPIEASEVSGLGEIITAEGDLRTLPSHLPNADPKLGGLDGFFAARLVKS